MSEFFSSNPPPKPSSHAPHRQFSIQLISENWDDADPEGEGGWSWPLPFSDEVNRIRAAVHDPFNDTVLRGLRRNGLETVTIPH